MVNKKPAAKGTLHFCSGCQCRHVSIGWYYHCTTCLKVYKRMTSKQKKRMAKIHKDIKPLLHASNRQEVDNTGCQLVALRERADMKALATTRALLSNHTVDVQIFSLGFLFLLYWQWPIVSASTLFIDKDLIQIPRQACRRSYMKQIEAVKDRIFEMYGPGAVLNGKMAVPREAEKYWAKEGHFL